jgi:hypothetical protein
MAPFLIALVLRRGVDDLTLGKRIGLTIRRLGRSR